MTDSGNALALDIVRCLFRAQTLAEAVETLEAGIARLGGQVVDADGDAVGERYLPVDVSLTVGRPRIVAVDPGMPQRRVLERHLPRLVEDARLVVSTLAHGARLAADTSVDPLTALPNRRQMERVFGRLAIEDCVVVMDLDRFKAVNERHGHQAGDEVLKAFAAVLRDTVRAADHCARWGGEEFVVALRRTDIAGAGHFCSRLRTNWAARAPLGVTFSSGIASVRQHGLVSVMRAADSALHVAKREGRDRDVVAHEPVWNVADALG